jgi:hypothetical protein
MNTDVKNFNYLRFNYLSSTLTNYFHPFEIADTTCMEIDRPQQHLCPEGFARITRDGMEDVYRVTNEETLIGEPVSFASSMDDFEFAPLVKSYGKTIVLHATDRIVHISGIDSFFSTENMQWKRVQKLQQLIPLSAGFLPIVRATEKLKLVHQITEEDLQKVAGEVYMDYLQRRSKLTFLHHRVPTE